MSFGDGGTVDWRLERERTSAASQYRIVAPAQPPVELDLPLAGRHNAMNATAALAAASAIGISVTEAAAALKSFRNVKRRLELLKTVRDISGYDDFAHHPTAIVATLEALRERVGAQPIIAVVEPRSNSMRLGAHQHELAPALATADHVILFAPSSLGWDPAVVQRALGDRCDIEHSIDEVLATIERRASAGSHVLIMSNGAFGGLHQRLLARLEAGV